MAIRFAEFPQSLFGRMNYLGEQRKIRVAIEYIGRGAMALSPEMMVGFSIPLPKKLKFDRAKKYLKLAKEKLNDMGVA